MRPLTLSFLVIASLVAFAQLAQSAEPEPGTGILAVGDFGVGGRAEARIGSAMRDFEAENAAQLLVTLGDNDYTERSSAFRENWRSSFGWLSPAGVAVAGVLGNHDLRVERGRYEFATLGMPGPTYRRRVGLVEVFVLDSNNVGDAQTRWLESALRRSQAPWKVVAVHHPAWTCGGHLRDDAIVARWVPLFERYRVRLVLAGHDHNYQRFVARRGVTYVVHGGGSGRFYAPVRCPAGYPPRARAKREWGFLYLVARAERLDGYAVSVAGRRTDHFALRP